MRGYVMTMGDGTRNGLVFATSKAAELYAIDLQSRWTGCPSDWTIAAVEEEPTLDSSAVKYFENIEGGRLPNRRVSL